ncbi:MAG: hypothetical protein KKH72_07925 [Alphaproteobacteria bacterium]|nr:hypothetical protein [Alphaproteobacteria bacterium]
MTATPTRNADAGAATGQLGAAGNPVGSRLENQAVAASILAFSVLFVTAQVLHPDPFAGMEPMSGAAYLEVFHNHPLVNFAHLLEFFSGALLIVLASHLYSLTRLRFPNWAFAALMMATTGAVALIGNKAAICLTASALDTLTEPQLLAMVPGLDVIVHRQGYLAVLWLLPLLPLGFAAFAILAWLGRAMPRWQAAFLLVGSLLLANPGVQALNTLGAAALAIALLPYGLNLARSA